MIELRSRQESRRRYSFSYADVGALKGVSAEACRRWFHRRGFKFSRDQFVENLKLVAMYAKNGS